VLDAVDESVVGQDAGEGAMSVLEFAVFVGA